MQDVTQPVDKKEALKPSEPERESGDRCRFCRSREFKRSRLHANDLFTLLQFKVPARCVRCGQLQTISIKTAKRALPPGSKTETAASLVAKQSDSGERAVESMAHSRAAVPYSVLQDSLDIRCQFCPGQTFRRSRFRLKDLSLLFGMHYSARCLRCGQRQTVNFMVAASGVPSNVKQARVARNTETWKEYTASSAPVLPSMDSAKAQPPVIEHLYQLKDAAPTAPLTPFIHEVYEVKESAPVAAPVKKAAPAVKKPVDDQAIW